MRTKSNKTHQKKAERCLRLIKESKGEVHWSKDALGMTYDFEFKNGSWLCVDRYNNKNNKNPYYLLTYTTYNKNYVQSDIFLKTTNMIGMKIYNELENLYNSTKTFPN